MIMIRTPIVGLSCCLLVGGIAPAGAAYDKVGARAPIRERIIFSQSPVNRRAPTRKDDVSMRSTVPPAARSRIVEFDPSHPERGVTNLTKEFASAGSPDVSFDGTRILFVGRRGANDRSGVWEMAADGSASREVIRFAYECLDAIYLSTIFTLDVEQPISQIAFVARAPEDEFPSIFTCRMDGTGVRRITFAPGGASDPFLLSDGRIVFQMGMSMDRQAADHEMAGTSALFTVNTAGTDLFPFAGLETGAPKSASDPCETRSGLVVYVESELEPPFHEALVAVTLSASLHSRRRIVDEIGVSVHKPSAIPDGRLLVSYRPANAQSFGVFVVEPDTGSPPELLFDDPLWDEMDPVALGPRPEPAGRSSVIDDRKKTGQLYCLDAYLSEDDTKSPPARESIHRIRVSQAKSVGESAPVDGSTKSNHTPAVETAGVSDTALGDFPVESDGSFSLLVPARTPLRLETLDESGRVLREMHSWIWVMPGERRGCIGCHEDRELTPPNRHVLALRKLPQRVGSVAVEPGEPVGRADRAKYSDP